MTRHICLICAGSCASQADQIPAQSWWIYLLPTPLKACTYSGAVYVFKCQNRSGDAWTQVAKLTAEDAIAYQSFGVSVSFNGKYLIVGAALDTENGQDSGTAYVYGR